MTFAGVLLMSIVAATPAPAPCSDAAWHQFDFWLGDWDVRGNDAQAQVKGRNTIRRVDGCALLEHWTGNGGVTGKSLNIYDTSDRRWHQTWVDNSGSLLMLAGQLIDRSMVMSMTGRARPIPR